MIDDKGQIEIKENSDASGFPVYPIVSCVGCKFLYSEGEGYSNYTWFSTFVKCAKNRNPNLINREAEEPADWDREHDNWHMTNNSRCELYKPGIYISLDIDGHIGPADESNDEEQIISICESSGCDRDGYSYS